MKKIFLSTFALLLIGSATMAQEKSGKAAAISAEKKIALKNNAIPSKTQAPAAKAPADLSGRKPAPTVSAAASLVEYKAAKAN